MLALLVAFAAGGALPIGTLSGDPGRLLVIFLGLVSASILPTIAQILASMTASGRSVHALNELQLELTAAIDALFLLFGLVAVAVIALFALSIPTPAIVVDIPFIAAVLHRFGQALVAAASILIVMRSGQIPGILRRSLNLRHKIAVDEARRKTNEAAPERGAMKASFPTHPEFGKAINLEDVKKRDPQ